jgi:hypothetical protein
MPSQNPGSGFQSEEFQTIDQIPSVLAIIDDSAFFDRPEHHRMERSRGIQSARSGDSSSVEME